MTDLEKELARQIHELDKEIKHLRERVAVLESRMNYVVTPPNQPYTYHNTNPYVTYSGGIQNC